MTRLAALILFLAAAPGLFGRSSVESSQGDERVDCGDVCEDGTECSERSDGVADCVMIP